MTPRLGMSDQQRAHGGAQPLCSGSVALRSWVAAHAATSVELVVWLSPINFVSCSEMKRLFNLLYIVVGLMHIYKFLARAQSTLASGGLIFWYGDPEVLFYGWEAAVMYAAAVGLGLILIGYGAASLRAKPKAG